MGGVRVLDVSGSYAGPYCSMMLGDMGAEVIKVEKPGTGDECRSWGPPFIKGESAWFLSVNRNKKSLTLNLKSPEGLDILSKLVQKADVFIENLRPTALERSGFGPEKLTAASPRLVYCAVTGFGMNGPLKDAPAYDLIAEGYGGIMSVSTEEGRRPLKVGTAASDIVAGMFAAFAVVSALYKREKTGQGEILDVSLLDGQIAFMAPRVVSWTVGDEPQVCAGGAESPIAVYRSFKTKDGWMTLGIGNDKIWTRFCLALGMEHLLDDPRYTSNKDRKIHQTALFPVIEGKLRTQTTRDWVDALSRKGIPCGPVNTCEEAAREPQVAEREMIVGVDHPTLGTLRLTGVPWAVGGKKPPLRLPPPQLGEHTDEILTGLLGISPDQVKTLRRNGVV